ncbi:MAG: ATP-binding protein [Planctomycetota bacterium]
MASYRCFIVFVLCTLPSLVPAASLLRAGSELNYPPLAVVRDDGSADGLGVDMLRAAAAVEGFSLRFQVAPWHELMTRLESGQLDVLPAMAHTTERAERFDFSLPYLRVQGAAFQRADHPVSDQLQNHTLLVMRDDIMHDYARRLPDCRLRDYPSMELAFQALLRGEGDVVLATRIVGWRCIQQLPSADIEESPLSIPVEQRWCFAVAKGRSDLLWRLNEGLMVINSNGEQERILESWLDLPPYDGNRLRTWLGISAAGILLIACIAATLFIQGRQHRQASTRQRIRHDVLFESLADCVLVHRLLPNGTCGELLAVNQATCSLLKYRREELIGSPASFIHSDTHPLCQQQDMGTCRHHCHELRSADNVVIPVEVRSRAFSIGPEQAVICVARDIRSRLQAEQALRESEARFRHYVDNAPHGIFVSNTNGDYIDCNRTACQLTGFSRRELLHMNIQELILADDREQGANLFAKLLKDGHCDCRIHLQRKSGGAFLAQAFAVMLDGHRAMAFISDITQQHAMEQELIDARDRAERLAEVAADADRAKSRFLATMSHEIRTPLNSMLGLGELLQHSPLDEVQAEHVDHILRSGNTLLHLLADILDLSKIEAGHLDIADEPFELDAVLDDLLATYRGGIDWQRVQLLVEVDPLLPRVMHGDADRLRQVLGNLLSNAIKFTADGSIRISASQLMEHTPPRFRVEVRDTGPGIPAAHLGALFKPFVQVHSDRNYGGTGLGLAISKRLVEMMGGWIAVSSQLEAGTCFSIELPLRGVSNDSSDPMPLFGRRYLLLAEHPQWRHHLQLQLQRQGATVQAPEETESLRPDAPIAAVLYAPHLAPGSLEDRVQACRRHAQEHQAPLIVLQAGGLEAEMSRQLQAWGVSAALSLPLPDRLLALAIHDRICNSDDSSRFLLTRRLQRATDQTDDASAPHQDVTALLVEDQQLNRIVAQRLLQHLGLQVTAVASGQEALEHVARTSFAFIFMDCQMPGMDGYEATGRIRTLEREQGRSPCPIIALTANAYPEDRQRCFDAGMDAHLTKPISLQAFKDMLGRWRSPHA